MTDPQNLFTTFSLSSHCSHGRYVRRGHGAGVDVTGDAHAVVHELEDQDDC